MSGLSETERAGFTKIMGFMSKADLLSLSDTVTNKMIAVENITGMFSTVTEEQNARIYYKTQGWRKLIVIEEGDSLILIQKRCPTEVISSRSRLLQ